MLSNSKSIDFQNLPLEYQHKAYMDSLTNEDKRLLANIKRFAELLVGDPDFRIQLQINHKNPDNVAKAYRLPFNINHLRSFWHNGYLADRYSKKEAEHSPLTIVWDRHLHTIRAHRDGLKYDQHVQSTNPLFLAWRARQVGRCDDTLAASGIGITHPSFAFELSEGCTVGCWFCGIGAEQFKGFFAYTEDNRNLWQSLLKQITALFGINPLKTAFCYWATDPSDNPDYDRFVLDFYKQTNFVPQTTTARPLKNIDLTQRILSLYDQHPCVFNRFSITTLDQLRAVHQSFSPLELLGTELVMQHKQSLASAGSKSPSGHAKEKIERLVARGQSQEKMHTKLNLNDDHTTIACVSGFLINMVNRSIKLVSPRPVSDKYPLGYRVHAEGAFSTAQSAGALMSQMVESNMPSAIPVTQVVRFHHKVTYQSLSNGFQLTTPARSFDVTAYKSSALTGEYLYKNSQNQLTYQALLKKIVSEGAEVFQVVQILQRLYQAGLFLDE